MNEAAATKALTEAQRAALSAFDTCEGGEVMSPYQALVLDVKKATLDELVHSGHVRYLSSSGLWKITAAGKKARPPTETP